MILMLALFVLLFSLVFVIFPRFTWYYVLSVILPPACPACRAASGSGAGLCAACWASVRFLAPPICPVLGTPFAHDMGPGIVSAAVLADPPPFARARSAVAYEDTARRLVHTLKYRDRHEVAGFMAKAMMRAGGELLTDCEVIVPVPLHPWRLWLRRFNQAALLADRIGRDRGIAFVAPNPFPPPIALPIITGNRDVDRETVHAYEGGYRAGLISSCTCRRI